MHFLYIYIYIFCVVSFEFFSTLFWYQVLVSDTNDLYSVVWFQIFQSNTVTVNESQIKIPAERGQDFVWHVKQRNKKTYLKFDAGENWENVEY